MSSKPTNKDARYLISPYWQTSYDLTVGQAPTLNITAGSMQFGGVAIAATAAELNKSADNSANTITLSTASTGTAVDSATYQKIILNSTVDVTHTLALPTKGDRLDIFKLGSSTKVHSIACTSLATFDGTNDVLTFNAIGEAITIVAASTARWVIMQNTGTVGASTS